MGHVHCKLTLKTAGSRNYSKVVTGLPSNQQCQSNKGDIIQKSEMPSVVPLLPMTAAVYISAGHFQGRRRLRCVYDKLQVGQ